MRRFRPTSNLTQQRSIENRINLEVICSKQEQEQRYSSAVSRLDDARQSDYDLVRCRKAVSDSEQGTKGQFNHSYSAARLQYKCRSGLMMDLM